MDINILHQITDLEDSHCANCLRKAEFRRQDADKMTELCITQCEIGKQIRELGKKLEGKTEVKPKRGRKSLFEKEELAKMAKTMTGKEIAKKCHVAPQSVSYYMKKYGIKPLGRWGKKGA